MTSYTTIATSEIDADSPITESLMTRLRDNPIAITEGSSGAPKIQTDGINDAAVTSIKIASRTIVAGDIAIGTITASELGASSVSTSEIATGAVDTSELAAGAVTDAKIASNTITAGSIAAGGVGKSEIDADSVGKSELEDDSVSQNELDYSWGGGTLVRTTVGSDANAMTGGGFSFSPILDDAGSNTATAYVNHWVGDGDNLSNSPYVSLFTVSSGNAYIDWANVYINASAPFDLGDGVIPLFIFLRVNAGGIISAHIAEAPPWAYSGDTDISGRMRKDGRKFQRMPEIKAELFEQGLTIRQAIARGVMTRRQIMNRVMDDRRVSVEVTQNIKNADINELPQPFLTLNPGESVVMVDPVGGDMQRLLKLHKERLLKTGFIKQYFNLSNTELSRQTPPGVKAYALNWKNNN